MTPVPCYFCERDVDAAAAGTFRLIEGWAQVRNDGGTHAIAIPSKPKAFAHRGCVERAKLGGFEQGSLFGSRA